jgi:hypothetical protein
MCSAGAEIQDTLQYQELICSGYSLCRKFKIYWENPSDFWSKHIRRNWTSFNIIASLSLSCDQKGSNAFGASVPYTKCKNNVMFFLLLMCYS